VLINQIQGVYKLCQLSYELLKFYFIILKIRKFSYTNCKRPEDGVLTPKHGEVTFNINLHYLFVHMLVYNKINRSMCMV
jgi:hypothetical protein